MTWWTLLWIVMGLAEIGIVIGGIRWLFLDIDGAIKVIGCLILLACFLGIPLMAIMLMAIGMAPYLS